MNFRTTFEAFIFTLCTLPLLVAAPIMRVHLPAVSNSNPDGLLFQGSETPVWVSQGTNGPTGVFFEVSNAGDGQVAPQVSGGQSSWLNPAVTGTQPCTFDSGKTCSRVQVSFTTAAMPAGTFLGEITVSDTNAADSPQRIPITIHIDGEVPDSISLYVAESEGNADFIEFRTPAGSAPTLTTQPTGQFLSVSSSGLGSFRFRHTHTVTATFSSGMAIGTHSGSITVSGSPFSQDNGSVPVAVHVTASPIAAANSDSVTLVTGPGINSPPGAVVFTNRGLGDLSVSSVDTALDNDLGVSLSTQDVGNNTFLINADVGDRQSGRYEGELSFNSNAANSPHKVSVALEVRVSNNPEAAFKGLVNGASFNFLQGVAPGAIVSLFGTNLANGDSGYSASTFPLPQELGGARVRVNGTDAPLFYASKRQVNFQVPFELSLGEAVFQVIRDGLEGNSISAMVNERSSGIFAIGIGAYGVIQNATQGNWPLPAQYSVGSFNAAPARPGDVLVIWATGLGPVDNPVSTGEAAPSSPLAWTLDRPYVNFSNAAMTYLTKRAAFAGLSPGFAGLYQVNVVIHPDAPTNSLTPVTLQFSDGTVSNTTYIAVER
jgi:uncharacterized protein (TIGR03437 family)